eukprot:2555562-Pyramimonas_sp.AAC.1
MLRAERIYTTSYPRNPAPQSRPRGRGYGYSGGRQRGTVNVWGSRDTKKWPYGPRNCHRGSKVHERCTFIPR